MVRARVSRPQSRARTPARKPSGKPRADGLEIYERDGHWHVRGTVKARGSSVRVRKSTGLAARPELADDASEVARQIEREIRDEIVWGIAPSVPLSEAVLAYLSRPRDRPLNPIDATRLKEIERRFGGRQLNRITDKEWIALVDWRMAGNKTATRERYIDLVMTFLRWCQAKPRRWLAELPHFERVKQRLYRKHRRARRVAELTPELIARLVDNAPPHLAGQIAVFWSTGARVSSLLYGCRLCDYLAAPGREQITFHDTKNGEPVTASLHPWAAAHMRRYLAWRGNLHDREAPLFLTDRRRPYKAKPKGGGNQIRTAFRAMKRRTGQELRRAALTEAAALRRAGRHQDARAVWHELRSTLTLLTQVTPHWFRHLLATTITDLADAMFQGGWLDPRSVNGYRHDVPERRRIAVNRMPAPSMSRIRRKDITA
jgi:hypothetical protein